MFLLLLFVVLKDAKIRTPPCMVAQTVMAKNRNNIFFINNKLIIDLVNVSH